MNYRLTLTAALGTVFGFVLGVSVIAPKAQHLELSYGWAQGTTAPDGTWWEHQFETDNTVSGQTWAVGVSDTLGHWGYRADFSKLLKFSTRNVAIPNEHVVDQFQLGQVSCSNGPQFCLDKWNGSGDAYGIHLGVFREFEKGGWKVQPELGVLPYRYHFGMELEALQTGAWTGIVHDDTGTTYAVTGYGRITFLHGHDFLQVTYDHNVKGHDPVVGIQQGKIVAASLGYQF